MYAIRSYYDGKFQRREHHVGIRDGDRGHVHRVAHLDQFLDRHRPFEERILGVNAQVDESGIGHGARLGARAGGRKGGMVSQ